MANLESWATTESHFNLPKSNYKPHQIATLQTILEECINGKLHNRKDVLKKISTLYKQDIDIFPSAPEEVYEEDDETETERRICPIA